MGGTVARASHPAYDAVVARAGGQCQATRTVRGKTIRCEHRLDLLVAPADPAVPEHAAWRVPVELQNAWCWPCLHDARRRVAARTRRLRPIAGQTDLMTMLGDESGLESGSVSAGRSGTNEAKTSLRGGVGHSE